MKQSLLTRFFLGLLLGPLLPVAGAKPLPASLVPLCNTELKLLELEYSALRQAVLANNNANQGLLMKKFLWLSARDKQKARSDIAAFTNAETE